MAKPLDVRPMHASSSHPKTRCGRAPPGVQRVPCVHGRTASVTVHSTRARTIYISMQSIDLGGFSTDHTSIRSIHTQLSTKHGDLRDQSARLMPPPSPCRRMESVWLRVRQLCRHSPRSSSQALGVDRVALLARRGAISSICNSASRSSRARSTPPTETPDRPSAVVSRCTCARTSAFACGAHLNSASVAAMRAVTAAESSIASGGDTPRVAPSSAAPSVAPSSLFVRVGTAEAPEVGAWATCGAPTSVSRYGSRDAAASEPSVSGRPVRRDAARSGPPRPPRGAGRVRHACRARHIRTSARCTPPRRLAIRRGALRAARAGRATCSHRVGVRLARR